MALTPEQLDEARYILDKRHNIGEAVYDKVYWELQEIIPTLSTVEPFLKVWWGVRDNLTDPVKNAVYGQHTDNLRIALNDL